MPGGTGWPSDEAMAPVALPSHRSPADPEEALLQKLTAGSLFRPHFLLTSAKRARNKAFGSWGGEDSKAAVARVLGAWSAGGTAAERTKRLVHQALGFDALWAKGDPNHPQKGRPAEQHPPIPDLILFGAEEAKEAYARGGQRASPPPAVLVFAEELPGGAIDFELKLKSPWSTSRVVVYTDGARWRLYLRDTGRLGEAREGFRYYEFDLAEYVRVVDHAQEPKDAELVARAGNWFTWFFSSAGIGEDEPTSFVHEGLAWTNRFVYGVEQSVFTRLGTALEHMARLVIALAREKGEAAPPVEELRERAIWLILRCVYLLMLEHNKSGGLRVAPCIAPLVEEHVVRARQTREGNVTADKELWPALLESFRKYRRAGVGSLAALLRQIRGVDDVAQLTAREATAHVGGALQSLATARLDDVHEAGLIDFGMLSVEHLGAIYERLMDLTVTVKGQVAYVVGTGKGKGEKGAAGGERRAAGAYFTPPALVSHLVSEALKGEFERILLAGSWEGVLGTLGELRIVDPTMGSGHFLVGAARSIRCLLVTAAKKYGCDSAEEVEKEFKNAVCTCLYGVDLNAALVTLARFAVGMLVAPQYTCEELGAHLRVGDSLWGCAVVADLEISEENELALCEAIWEEGLPAPDMAALRERIEAHARASGKDWLGGWDEAASDQAAEWRKTPAYRQLKVRADRRVSAFDSRHFHWCLEFPCVVGTFRGGFHAVVGNPPWAEVGEQYMEKGPALTRLRAFLQGENERSKADGSGMYALVPLTRHTLYNCFLHRAVALTDSELAFVVRSTFLTNLGSRVARQLLQDACPMKVVHGFTQRYTKDELFPGVNHAACTVSASKGHHGPVRLACGTTLGTLLGEGCVVELNPYQDLEFIVPMVVPQSRLVFEKLRSIEQRLKGRLTSAKGTRKAQVGECSSGEPLWEGTNILGAFTLGGPCKRKCRLSSLPEGHKWHRARPRIGMKQVCDPADHFRTGAVLLEPNVPCDASIVQFFLADEAPDEHVYFYLALLNSFVIDWYVRRLTGESKNLSQGTVLHVPMPNVDLTTDTAADPSAEWARLLQKVPDEAKLLLTVDGLFDESLSSVTALLIHGARAQVAGREEWGSQADPKGRKDDVSKYMNVNKFSPGSSSSTTDVLRRGQVLLNHLVARAYGMSAEDLRRVHADLEVFWVGKHA